MNDSKGFTLIELLVVISIIALLSSVVVATVAKSRIKARDSQRIQNARQLAIALEQYEHSFNTYKVANSGLNDTGSGFVAKGGGGGYTTSILSALKSAGLYTNTNLKDPIFGLDNYYLGLCTSTNAYNIFVKLEQPQYNNATSSIVNSCGGAEAASLGFNFIASTVGGTSGGGGDFAGLGGSYDAGLSAPGAPITGPDGLTYIPIIAEDGRTWLDRNLGATRVATAHNDYQAYGSKFQWGRLADGHQLINYTSVTAGTGINGSTTTVSSSDTPGNNLFYYIPPSPYDWRSPQNNSLWQGTAGTNNPCPTGFRIPTQTEWQTWATAANYNTATCGGTNSCHIKSHNNLLKLTSAGWRRRADAGFDYLGTYGFYWSSTVSSTNVYVFFWNLAVVLPDNTQNRSYGLSVRCIKN